MMQAMHILPGCRMSHHHHPKQTATPATASTLALTAKQLQLHSAAAANTATSTMYQKTPTAQQSTMMEEEPSASSTMDDAFPRDRIQVAVRLRPMQTAASAQSKDHAPGWIVQEDDNQIVQKGVAVRKVVGRTVFAMDSVYSESTSTRTVYERSVQPIVQQVFAGVHGTVFAYGQTGSGKTYTMQGRGVGDENQEGIISMAAMDLFNMIHNAGPVQESTVRVSYYEVYNEEIRDLLVEPRSISPAADARSQQQRIAATGCFRRINSHTSGASCSSSAASTACQRRLPALTIRETPDGNVYVNACQETVTCAQDVLQLLHKGNCHRACAATDANAQSSRSHAIFKLSLETRIAHDVHDMRPISMDQADVAVLSKKRVSWINLVDLAGSESGRHTGGTAGAAARRLEGGKINQSLLALSRVIHSLSLPDKKRPKFIGYRDSKLTRILQPSLSGSACVAILCCASLARSDLEETRSTLKFAASAKQIKVKATVNEVADASTAAAMEIARLQRELFEVKNELTQLKELFLMQRPKQETTAKTNAIVRPLCVGCIETTGSSTTEDCSYHDDTTSSTASPTEEEELLNNHDNVDDKAHVMSDDDKDPSFITVGGCGDEHHSHTSSNGRITHMSDDDYDDNTTLLSLGDYCSAQSLRPPVVELSWSRSSGSSSSSSSSNRGQQQELVEKLCSDLQNAMKELQVENRGSLEELEERLLRLEEDKASRSDEERILLGWLVLLCFGLYACGMKEICLSALIFVALSLQFTTAAAAE